MLEKLREATRRSAFAYILVFLLVAIFAVYFGVPTDGLTTQTGPNAMAVVGKQTVYDRDVNLVYNRFWGGQRESRSEEAMLTQQAMALRTVMLIHLLADRAEQAGLRVDDKEFQEFILDPLRNMDFQFAYGRSGGFDGTHYKNYVQHYLRASIPHYEEFKRRELLARKYMTMLDMQLNAAPHEVDEIHTLRNTKVNLEFVQFQTENIKDAIGVSEEEVQALLRDSFDDVQRRYEASLSDYQTPEQLLIRRIFITKADSGAKPEDLVEVAERYDAAKRRVIQEGEDFAAVARELSEDYARDNGGLLDWSSVENLDQDIVAAISGKEKGEIVEVNTEFALMLVRIEDRKPAVTTALSEVQEDIAREMLQRRKVDTHLNEMSQKFLEVAKNHSSLRDALKQLQETEQGAWSGVTVSETGLFNMEPVDMAAMLGRQFADMQFSSAPWNQIPRLGRSTELMVEAFNLTPEQALSSTIYDLNNAKVVVRLLEREEPDELTEETRVKLATEIRNKKSRKTFGGWHQIFAAPSDDYGQWLESLYEQSLEDGSLKLLERNNPVASYVKERPTPASLLSVN